MNDLILLDSDLKVTKPKVEFTAYKTLKNQALQIAEQVKIMEVNEDNIKDTKKVLAKVNKAVKELNNRRIAAKKEILEPYTVFENQVKEIEKIVKEADELVRSQVRELEEKERQEKEEEIKKLWDLRIEQYEYAKIMDFDHFMRPELLNKSCSMRKVEKEMVDTLEQYENDLKLLSSMDDGEELITDYIEYQSLTVTLAKRQQRNEEKQKIKEVLKESTEEEIEERYVFEVFNKKDFNFVKTLMKNNEIEFKEI